MFASIPPPTGPTGADEVGVIALILIVAFAIDRVAVAIMYALSLIPAWRSAFPSPVRIRDEEQRMLAARRLQFIYYVLASILAIVTLSQFEEVRILRDMLNVDVDGGLDFVITGVALVGGADRIAALLKSPGTPGVSGMAKQPVEVKGTLTLEKDEEEEAK